MSAEEKKTLSNISNAWNKLPPIGHLTAISYINGYADGFIAGQDGYIAVQDSPDQPPDSPTNEPPTEPLAEEQAS